ncbi:maleylacetate reductase [Pseudonocardia xishanensis]|uniref:Maleylacetate reductase n=1 Tax=Pseudonocardia xishanensis TaxID=630995 RepID=A0ABP8RQJ2_9PSEU
MPAEQGFVHEQRALRVVLRRGAVAEVPAEIDRLGARRVLLVGSARHGDGVARALAGSLAARVTDPRMHVPIEQAVAARALADEHRIDACVAVGGGSAIGLAKAVALHRPVPVLAVPTTLSGSEATRVWGLTEGGVKRTGKDPAVAPRVLVYDPDLAAALTVARAVPSLVNALAHAVEALWAPDRTPLTDVLAAEGATVLVRVLQGLAPGSGPTLAEHADAALHGAWLCGTVLDATTMSLHHKLAHTLGGTFGLPHAEVHTVLLPHVLAFNAPADAEVFRRVLGGPDPADRLQRLIADLCGPTSLGALGFRASDVARATELALASPYANPRPLDAAAVRELLTRALGGDRPRPE